MFEENKNNIDEFDLSFRSVLEEAQEQVPAHVWDGIEGELDRISQRRVAVLWFRRAAVGAAAAAAVIGTRDKDIRRASVSAVSLDISFFPFFIFLPPKHISIVHQIQYNHFQSLNDRHHL